MARPKAIELPDGTIISILYEDRAVLAIDKPAGWMLAPESWDRTSRNLHLALISGIKGGDFWAAFAQPEIPPFRSPPRRRHKRSFVACEKSGRRTGLQPVVRDAPRGKDLPGRGAESAEAAKLGLPAQTRAASG